MGDDWWKKAQKAELLLKCAKKGDKRALRKVERYTRELEREHGIMQIVEAFQNAVALKQYAERPRYIPEFRKSYVWESWQDGLILGRNSARSYATA